MSKPFSLVCSCGETLSAHVRFCSECGTPANHALKAPLTNGGRGLRQEPRVETAEPAQRTACRRRKQRETPGASLSEGKAAFEELKTRVRLKRARRLRSLAATMLLLTLVTIASIFFIEGIEALQVQLTLVTFLIACYGMFAKRDRNLTRREYLSLPGSQQPDGRPRCIHCGHRGVYIRGAYASQSKWHDCSRCQTNLFQE